jgi:hypothetical protein
MESQQPPPDNGSQEGTPSAPGEDTTRDHIVTFSLLGQSYSFRSETELATAKAIARYVTEEVDRVERQVAGSALSDFNRVTILVLAAMNIANETFLLRSEKDALIQTLALRTDELIRRLDSGLAECHVKGD